MVTRDLLALRALLDRLPRPPIAGVELACKHFFSGAAAYANGRIFMSLTPVGLALKLPEETRAALIDRGGTATLFSQWPDQEGLRMHPRQARRRPSRPSGMDRREHPVFANVPEATKPQETRPRRRLGYCPIT